METNISQEHVRRLPKATMTYNPTKPIILGQVKVLIDTLEWMTKTLIDFNHLDQLTFINQCLFLLHGIDRSIHLTKPLVIFTFKAHGYYLVLPQQNIFIHDKNYLKYPPHS